MIVHHQTTYAATGKQLTWTLLLLERLRTEWPVTCHKLFVAGSALSGARPTRPPATQSVSDTVTVCLITGMRPGCLLLLAAAAAAPAATHGFVHSWDTVGEMLAMNPHAAGNGRYNDSPFALKHWKWVADNYAVVVLGRFEDFGSDFDPVHGYNCTCPMESSRVQVARILKGLNPKIKLLWYQNVVGDMTCVCCNEPLRSHPEWWVWDDHGRPVTHGSKPCFPANASDDRNCSPYVNWTIPEAREWWYTQPLREVCGSDGASLVDGMMMDGTMYNNPRDPQGRLPDGGNLSTARYDAVFAGKMLAMEEGSKMYRDMNGGEMWGSESLSPLLCVDAPIRVCHPGWHLCAQPASANLTLR